MASPSGTGDGSRRRGAAGRSHARSSEVIRNDENDILATKPNQAAKATVRSLGVPAWSEGSRILAALPEEELDQLRPHLVTVALGSGTVLYEAGAIIKSVYFPNTAVLSLLSRMDNGAVVEVGTIGNEGMGGLGLFLGATTSLSQMISQIPGDAQCIPAAVFASAARELPHFHTIIAGCTHAFMTQVSQTAACNRLHGIEQRCARWLLLTHDRVGGANTFPLTHEFLSFMLGVRRAGVSEALGALSLAALITSSAGHIVILDRIGLEDAACECYAIVRLHGAEPFEMPALQ
jgi:CRP-like cAMP-binding protein